MASSSLEAHVQLPHVCSHTCQVQQEFGNVFRCCSSGLIHVCDSNCNQRLYYDRYNTICRISKKLHPAFATDTAMDVSLSRKREVQEELAQQEWKRRQAVGFQSCTWPTA